MKLRSDSVAIVVWLLQSCGRQFTSVQRGADYSKILHAAAAESQLLQTAPQKAEDMHSVL